jgi:hypothetical protein
MPFSELRARILRARDKSTTNLSATPTSHHHDGHFRHRDLSLDHRRSRFVDQRSIDRQPLDAPHSVHCQDRCPHVRVCLLVLGQRTGLRCQLPELWVRIWLCMCMHDTNLRTSCEYVWSCATRCLRFAQEIERHRACGSSVVSTGWSAFPTKRCAKQ